MRKVTKDNFSVVLTKLCNARASIKGNKTTAQVSELTKGQYSLIIDALLFHFVREAEKENP